MHLRPQGRHRPTKTERACRECGHPEVDHYLNDGCYGEGLGAGFTVTCHCPTPYPHPLVETWESSRQAYVKPSGWARLTTWVRK